MKRALLILSCLFIANPLAYADTGVTKAVKKDAKAMKEVQTHKAKKQAKKVETQVEEESKTVIPFIRSVKKPDVAAAQQKAAEKPTMKKKTTKVTKQTTKTTRSTSGGIGACGLTARTYSQHYGTQLGGHLGRGFLNALSGWIEIARISVKKTREGAPVVGMLTGITEGAAIAVLRTASGVIDIPSGLVPNYTNELYFKKEPTIGCYQ